MPNFWFTSDTHFGHEKIIKYCDRPFSNANEMDETIIENWNKRIRKNDIVYHLGDFSMGDPTPYIKRLNGKIHLLLGNHDRYAHKAASFWQWTKTISIAKMNGFEITLCHYAMLTWKKSCYNTWSLHGHTHGRIEPVGKSWDVGVDNNRFRPLSLEEIESIMKKRPNNIDYVGE